MTKDEMRVAIATDQGWKYYDDYIGAVKSFSGAVGRGEAWGSPDGSISFDAEPPNYPDDLNAMHEAEKILTPEQEEQYVERLAGLVMIDAYENDPRYNKSHLSSGDSTYRCTAIQRAEAYLRTRGLWKD